MARWRGKKKQQEMLLATLFGIGGLLVLGWLASKIPWDSVFFGIFILILIGFAGFALYQLFRVIQFHSKTENNRKQRFVQASQVRGVTHETTLSPTEFEHYVGTIYENLGYSVVVTPPSGDKGIDLILTDRDGKTTGVQIKRYQTSRVGVPELQHLVGACSKKYDKMLFVTSSDYLNTAREYASEQSIELINGEALTEMHKKIFTKEYYSQSLASRFYRKMEELI